MENENVVKEKFGKLNIIGIILLVIFLPIIGINTSIVIQGFTDKDDIPMVFGYAPLIVLSDSMSINAVEATGEFNENDLIIIKEIDPDDLKPGDVITYHDFRNNRWITHRIFKDEINKDGERVFITQGDTSPGVDQYPVTYDQVEGIYVTRFAGLGKTVDFLQSTEGVLVVLGIPLLIFFAIDYFSRMKERNQEYSKAAELEAELAALKAEKAKKEEEEENKEVE